MSKIDATLVFTLVTCNLILNNDCNDFVFRTLISHSVLRHPYSVAMFEDFIYWSDVLDRSVMRMSKMSHNNVSTVHLEQTAPLDIKIMHAVQQPRGLHCFSFSFVCILCYLCVLYIICVVY